MSVINMEYLNKEMNTLALNDKTIKELYFTKPELTLLIKNSLIEIDSLSKSLELIERYHLCDVQKEINDYFNNNDEYIIFYKDDLIYDLAEYIDKENRENIKRLKEKIKDLSDEEQIEVFNKEKNKQRNLAYGLLDIMDTLDKDIVKELIKEYDF